LQNAYLDVFIAGAEPFGVPNALDITFIRDRTDPDTVRYARNRDVVGERVGDVPPRIALQGEACADVTLTAGRDLEDMHVTASGVTEPIDMSDVPISQDDPEDFSTASNKADLYAESELSLFHAELVGQRTDFLRFFLMYDANEDDDFTYPDEMVTSGIGKPFHQLMYTDRPLPSGHYQVWVHGYDVPDGESTFDVKVTAIHGTSLRLENAPSGLREGQAWTFQVCSGDIGEDIDVPAVGAITYQYSSPPRLFRTMIDWSPEDLPPTATPPPTTIRNFLPVNLSGVSGR
jgi:hypothetical protein